MSWLLKHNKKTNKYRLWTTISDGWLTDWLTKGEMLQELLFRQGQDNKLRIIELYMTFPAGFYDKDSRLPLSTNKTPFFEWQKQAINKGSYEDYQKEIDEQYARLTSQKPI